MEEEEEEEEEEEKEEELIMVELINQGIELLKCWQIKPFFGTWKHHRRTRVIIPQSEKEE